LKPPRRKHIRDLNGFLTRVQKLPSGCWAVNCWHKPDGYARLRFKGKKMLAHRLAYLLATGKDPGELQVCHKCDNPGCVNPEHLFLGTGKDNVKDCITKGRFRGWANSPFVEGHPYYGTK
jgi:hypothetical protein